MKDKNYKNLNYIINKNVTTTVIHSASWKHVDFLYKYCGKPLGSYDHNGTLQQWLFRVLAECLEEECDDEIAPATGKNKDKYDLRKIEMSANRLYNNFIEREIVVAEIRYEGKIVHSELIENEDKLLPCTLRWLEKDENTKEPDHWWLEEM